MSQANTAPARVQRKRTVGWTMPENTIYVGRPTKWGNPYRVGYYNIHEAIVNYECWLAEMVAKYPKFLEPLRGKNLACWCPSWSLCHVDILLREANK